MAHEVPPLPYDYNALEPHIDEQTMRIHHDKHHAAYVNNLNAALEKHPELQQKSVEDLIKGINTRAGGHPHRGPQQRRRPRQPHDVLGDHGPGQGRRADRRDRRRDQVVVRRLRHVQGAVRTRPASKRFGSGWAWLIDAGGKLVIESTANQDSPLMEGKKPILGLDVWEHAYYLKYQNRRPDYLARVVERRQLGRGHQAVQIARRLGVRFSARPARSGFPPGQAAPVSGTNRSTGHECRGRAPTGSTPRRYCPYTAGV